MGAIWRYIHTKLKFRGVTMAVPDQVPFNQYTASGVSASFTYSFKILDADQLLIKLDGVAQTTGFTVGGVAADAGGVVTFSAAPAAGVLVELIRSTPASRSTDYAPNGDLQESVLDADFDRAYMALQEMQEQVDRTMKLPQGATGSLDLESLTPNAYLQVNSAGTAVSQVLALTPSGSFAVTPFAETLLDDADAAAMRATLGAVDVAGAEAAAIGRLIDVQVFTTSGTWTKPVVSASGRVEVILQGGGASGGSPATSTSSNVALGANGGSGGYFHGFINAAELAATEAVTVGVGGAEVLNAASGNAGAESRFSSSGVTNARALGGGKGTDLANGSTVAFSIPGLGGAVSWAGVTWQVLAPHNGSDGDLSRRLSGTQYVTGRGANSQLGHGGQAAGVGFGFTGTGYGTGGSGAVTANGDTGSTSGAGTDGIVIIKTYY